MKAEWSCATGDSGEQCVTTAGTESMLQWPAFSLDTLLMVYIM